MKKAIYQVSNCTGRIFVCISNDSEYAENFEDHFKVGYNYKEAIKDPDGDNLSKSSDDVVLLLDKNDIPIYVELECFILIERKVSPIARTKIWLN